MSDESITYNTADDYERCQLSLLGANLEAPLNEIFIFCIDIHQINTNNGKLNLHGCDFNYVRSHFKYFWNMILHPQYNDLLQNYFM